MAAFSDYMENKLIDFLLRGQTFTPPATLYWALFTVAPTDSTAGTEVTGGSYARVSYASTLANWAGTQGAGTTVASSGASGTTSNNAIVAWPTAPTANWGAVVGMALMDASTAGNVIIYSPLAATKNINVGDPAPTFPVGTFTFQIDT